MHYRKYHKTSIDVNILHNNVVITQLVYSGFNKTRVQMSCNGIVIAIWLNKTNRVVHIKRHYNLGQLRIKQKSLEFLVYSLNNFYEFLSPVLLGSQVWINEKC